MYKMENFQRGIVIVSFASLTVYTFLSLVSVEKSLKWIKWYWKMDEEEKKNYNPKIAMYRIRKVLITMFAVGITGFFLSSIINPVISIVTFVIIVAILVFSVGYCGPKNCLLVEKK